MQWYLKVLREYANFSGRARRKEYWYFYLINFLISFGIGMISGVFGFMNPDSGLALASSALIFIYSMAVLIPSLAVGVRRLHDTNRSGWWLLISLIPLIGAIVLIIFFVEDSQPGTNQYGENPKQAVTPKPQL